MTKSSEHEKPHAASKVHHHANKPSPVEPPTQVEHEQPSTHKVHSRDIAEPAAPQSPAHITEPVDDTPKKSAEQRHSPDATEQAIQDNIRDAVQRSASLERDGERQAFKAAAVEATAASAVVQLYMSMAERNAARYCRSLNIYMDSYRSVMAAQVRRFNSWLNIAEQETVRIPEAVQAALVSVDRRHAPVATTTLYRQPQAASERRASVHR